MAKQKLLALAWRGALRAGLLQPLPGSASAQQARPAPTDNRRDL
jgi:hypothetical protein